MSEYAATIPLVIVALAAIVAMVAEAFREPGERMPIAWLGIIGLVGSAIVSVVLWDSDARSMGVIRSDNFALFINLVLCAIGILTMLMSGDVVEREQIPAGEYYALTLFGISGMMMMAAATDLLVVFLAIYVGAEPVAVPPSPNVQANESGSLSGSEPMPLNATACPGSPA